MAVRTCLHKTGSKKATEKLSVAFVIIGILGRISLS